MFNVSYLLIFLLGIYKKISIQDIKKFVNDCNIKISFKTISTLFQNSCEKEVFQYAIFFPVTFFYFNYFYIL